MSERKELGNIIKILRLLLKKRVVLKYSQGEDDGLEEILENSLIR